MSVGMGEGGSTIEVEIIIFYINIGLLTNADGLYCLHSDAWHVNLK